MILSLDYMSVATHTHARGKLIAEEYDQVCNLEVNNMYVYDKLQYTMLTASGSGTGGGPTVSAINELLNAQHVQHMRDNVDGDNVAASTCMPTLQTPCAS